jgi:hypothetical protein
MLYLSRGLKGAWLMETNMQQDAQEPQVAVGVRFIVVGLVVPLV